MKLKNLFVKHFAPNYMLFHKLALTIILKHQKWLSSKVEKSDKIKLTIMPKSDAHLQTITKELAKVQIDQCQTL